MKAKNSSSGRMILTLFMIILFIGGTRMLVGSIGELMQSWQALSWPVAEGHIIRSEMKNNTHNVRHRGSDGILRSANGSYYTAEVEYEFQLNGTVRKGNKITAIQGGNLADESHVQQTLDRYPIGQSVRVSYNPADLSQCVLEPGSWGVFFVWAGLSLFLILIPAFTMWIACHPKHSKLISGI